MTLHTIYYRAGQAALAIFAAAMIGGAVGVSCAIGIYVGALNITLFERSAKNHVEYVDEANRRDGAAPDSRYRAEYLSTAPDGRCPEPAVPASGTLTQASDQRERESAESAREREKPLRLRSADIDSVLPTKTLKPEARIESTPLTFEQTQPPEIVEQLKEYVDRSESYMTEPASRFD